MSQRTPRTRSSSSAGTGNGGGNIASAGGGKNTAAIEAPPDDFADRDYEAGIGLGDPFNLATLKEMSISKLTQIAKDLDVPGASGMRKQELIFKVLAAQTEKSGLIFSEVVV